MNIIKFSLRSFPIFLLLVGLLASSTSDGYSQTNQNWSPQQRVPGYADETLPPYLVADHRGIVHAFTSQWVGEVDQQLAVVYNQWSFNGDWTPVVDVILSPLGQARVMGVFLDQNGIMHLIFFGGDDRQANIYYTRATAVEAGLATAWMEPQLVGGRAITPSTAALAGDEKGNLIVIYSGNMDGNGIYSIYSNDYGKTWSKPEQIYWTASDQLWPAGIDIYMGKSGFLHAVWYVADERGHNQSAHYARFETEKYQWDEPIEFDKGIGIDEGMGIMNPSVIEHKGDVFIFYNNGIPPTGVPPTQWFIRSTDLGKTWSYPTRAFARHVGRNGSSSFVVDSDGTLHVLFPDRIPITVNGVYDAISGMWHSIWSSTGWSEPEAVVAYSGTELAAIRNANPSTPEFNPYDALGVISQGNIILLTWRTDPGLSGNGVWFSYRKLDAVESPVIPLPNRQEPLVTPTSISVLFPAEEDLSFAQSSVDLSNMDLPADSISPSRPIIIGGLSAIVIIISVVLLRKATAQKVNHT